MDDTIARPVAARPQLSEAELERRRGRPWTLRVASVADVGPHLRRVQLTADDLGEFSPKPGQEIVLQIPQDGPEPARRHYTIRRFDPATRLIDVDFVIHEHMAPGVRWALEAKPGQSIDIRGPRGRIGLSPGADWHLFSGEETAMPAILALTEALPKGAKAYVFLEIGGAEDKMPVTSHADVSVTWLSRDGAPPAPSRLLPDALDAFTLPPGTGHAVIIGETSTVRAQRHSLIERGLTRQQIYSEGYWRPGRIGGHDHVEE
ncbi:MAG TPA: siderophore-interacting protein [Stellaceae bacterium]|nr:siderophore-interacting protein [Stellaceae bacterium]